MERDRYLATFRENTAKLAAAARLGLDAPVPTCPDWLVSGLVGHIGGVHLFWWHIVSTHATEPGEFPREALESASDLWPWLDAFYKGEDVQREPPAGLVEWYEGAAARLEEALRAADPDEPAWHWSGDNRVLSTVRMQAVESAVHRWDAQNAHGRAEPIQDDLARAGIDHHFEVMLPNSRSRGEPRPGEGESYHLHCTDGPGEWLARFDDNRVTVTREHAKADVAIRGSASDLFLFLWGRVPASVLSVVGDAGLLERYRELVPPA